MVWGGCKRFFYNGQKSARFFDRIKRQLSLLRSRHRSHREILLNYETTIENNSKNLESFCVNTIMPSLRARSDQFFSIARAL